MPYENNQAAFGLQPRLKVRKAQPVLGISRTEAPMPAETAQRTSANETNETKKENKTTKAKNPPARNKKDSQKRGGHATRDYRGR